MALTMDRHVKLNQVRHEKDDREIVANPRHYILGWNNEAKIKVLRQELEHVVQDHQRALVAMDQHDAAVEAIRSKQDGIRRALEIRAFAEMDHEGVDAESAALIREKEMLEESDEAVSALTQQFHQCRNLKQELKQREATSIKRLGVLEREAVQAAELLATAERRIQAAQETGEFEDYQTLFPSIDTDL